MTATLELPLEDALRQAQIDLELKNKIASIFLTVPDDSMFGDVLRTVLDVTASEDGVFGYVDSDGALVCSAILRRSTELRTVARLPREEWSEVWKILLDKRSLCTNQGSSFLPIGHVPVHRMLITPILYQDEMIGHFAVANKVSDYQENDLHLLESLAGYVAPVLKVRLQRDSHEKQLTRALEAKEMLLREVHHRVKNNLQIISSLLHLQARSQPAAVQDILHESQKRVMAMALVHDQLHQHADAGELDFASYAKKLASDLWNACQTKSGHMQLRFELAPVKLTLSQAIPCGLILNELVTNALKHAFPQGQKGEILISVQRTAGKMRLQVADDGVGLPPGFEWEHATSLGIQIVSVLGRQLNATLRCEGGQGFSCTLTFAPEATTADASLTATPDNL